jgi:hypothetical protein
MRHHKPYRYWFIALIVFTLAATGLLILHFTGKQDLRQFTPARVILPGLLVTATAVWLIRWRYRRQQQQLNKTAGSQGTLLLLAPHPDIPLETHDFFRRFPAQYVQREKDGPCAHTAFELTGNQFQINSRKYIEILNEEKRDKLLQGQAERILSHSYYKCVSCPVSPWHIGSCSDKCQGIVRLFP